VRGFIRWCRQQGPGVGRGAGPWRGSGSSGRRSADPFAGPGLPEADGCDVMPRLAEVFGPLRELGAPGAQHAPLGQGRLLYPMPGRVACMCFTGRVRSAWCPGSAGPVRRCAGSIPASCRICHTVEAATWWPSLTSSPCTRRCPSPDCRLRCGSRACGSRLSWTGVRDAAGWCSPTCARPAAGARRAESPGSPRIPHPTGTGGTARTVPRATAGRPAASGPG